MDHVFFLAQEGLEAVQVKLGSASSNVGGALTGLREGAVHSLHRTAATVNTSWQSVQGRLSGGRLSCSLHDAALAAREALQDYRPSLLYDRCFIFICHEVSRTHAYLFLACFLTGTIFGICIGSQNRRLLAAPQKMRAVVATSYSGLESISVVEDVCAPRLYKRDQILVQVKAAGVDQLDLSIAKGYGRCARTHLNRYNPNCSGSLPVVLGRDCAGVVVAVGADVDDFAPGEEVWLAVPLHHPGTLCEYLVVARELVCKKPVELSMEAAAALPYSVMQAWGMLEQAGVTDGGELVGKRCLVQLGVSSVGVVLVQLLVAWGAHVTATLSNNNHVQLARMLGVHDVVCLDETDLDKALGLREKFAVILNTAGMALHSSSLTHCLPDGVVVSSAVPPIPADSLGVVLGALYSAFLRLRFLITKSGWVRGEWYGSVPLVSGAVLRRVAPLVSAGQLQPVVDKAYNCQDAEFAFAHIDTVQQVGKTIIRFREATLSRTAQLAFSQGL